MTGLNFFLLNYLIINGNSSAKPINLTSSLNAGQSTRIGTRTTGNIGYLGLGITAVIRPMKIIGQ